MMNDSVIRLLGERGHNRGDDNENDDQDGEQHDRRRSGRSSKGGGVTRL
jgi:hypothetical protein